MADMSSVTISAVGRIDERGYLRGFDRRGFTPAKCFNELIANCLDAIEESGRDDGVIELIVKRDNIYFGDNGTGMDREGVEYMFAIHRENHKGKKTRGVSGVGAKPSICILSEKKAVFMLTRKSGGEYLRVDIPWDAIFRDGVYTGMITVRTMTDAEITLYGRDSGTVICFPYTETLANVIRQNFYPTESIAYMPPLDPLDRTTIVFGRDTVPIIYTHFEESGSKELNKYDYFGDRDSDYYTGISYDTINLYQDSKTKRYRYIWDDVGDEKECNVRGGGYDKEPTEAKDTTGWKLKGSFEVVSGIRRDKAIFDDENPVPISAEDDQIDALTESLGLKKGSEKERFLIESKLVRNGQTIGTVPIPDITYSSARANGKSYMYYKLLQCEVRFTPVSDQINHLDMVMAVEENKNKHSGSALPIPFTRLVKAIRAKKADEIWEYFNEKCEEARQAREALEEEESESEVEEEEDTGVSIIELLRNRRTATSPTTTEDVTSVSAPTPITSVPVAEVEESQSETEATVIVPEELPIAEDTQDESETVISTSEESPITNTEEQTVLIETPVEPSVSGFELHTQLVWLLERINTDISYKGEFVELSRMADRLARTLN